MPRSFLVKQNFRGKKPDYRDLGGPGDLVLPESSPLTELWTGPNCVSVGLVWNPYVLPDLFAWASTSHPCPSPYPLPTQPLDLSPISRDRSQKEEEGRTSDPSIPPEHPGHSYVLRCDMSNSTFAALSHPPTQQPVFNCKHCPKEYGSLGALKMHIRSHSLPCVCPSCGKAFSRPWLLRGHIRTHTGERPFSCPHCKRAFADRSNLRAHLQTHSQVKRYHCRACSRSFGRMSLLHKHSLAGCIPGL